MKQLSLPIKTKISKMNLKIKNMIQLHAAYKSLPLDLKTWIDWKWKNENHHLCKLWTEDLIWLKDQPSWFLPSPKEWDITFLEFLLGSFFLSLPCCLYRGSILSTSLRHCSQAWPPLWWSETSMLYGFWGIVYHHFSWNHIGFKSDSRR